MQNNDNRKIFLNVKETLNGNDNIKNVEIQLDDKQYVVSADINNTSKLAFGIKKTDGIAFIKASVKTEGITDERITEICEPIVEDRNVNYAIQINKVVFQSVIPVRANTIEENNKFVFEEIRSFVEAVSICCETLGDGHIIHLEYKEYGKKQIDVDNPLGETISVTPNTDVVKEAEVREEINKMENQRTKSNNKPTEEIKEKSEDDEIKDIMAQSVVSVDDFIGSDIPDSFTAIPSDEMDIDTEEPIEKPKSVFTGSIPIDEFDDFSTNDINENNEDLPLIIKDEDSNSEEENISLIQKENNISLEEDKNKEIADNIKKEDIVDKERKEEDVSTEIKDKSMSIENEDTKKDELDSSMKSLKDKMNQEKELIKERDKQLEEEKERRREPFRTVKNDDITKNQNANTNKNSQNDKSSEKVNNRNNDRNNKVNERQNDRQKQNGGNKLDRDNKSSINNIFANYERDLKNVENKYKNQIRNLNIDELLQLIENRYNQDDANQLVSDYIKEKLCNIAKDELKFRVN